MVTGKVWEGNVSLAFDFALVTFREYREIDLNALDVCLRMQTSAVLGHPDSMQRCNALILKNIGLVVANLALPPIQIHIFLVKIFY